MGLFGGYWVGSRCGWFFCCTRYVWVGGEFLGKSIRRFKVLIWGLVLDVVMIFFGEEMK